MPVDEVTYIGTSIVSGPVSMSRWSRLLTQGMLVTCTRSLLIVMLVDREYQPVQLTILQLNGVVRACENVMRALR